MSKLIDTTTQPPCNPHFGRIVRDLAALLQLPTAGDTFLVDSDSIKPHVQNIRDAVNALHKEWQAAATAAQPPRKPDAWRVPIAGTYEYFSRREDAARERSEYEASCGGDAEHCEPEPLYASTEAAATAAQPQPATDATELIDDLDELASDMNYEGNCEGSQEKKSRAALIDRGVRLLKSLAAATAAQPVPAGWKLVPRSPSGPMLGAGVEARLRLLGPSNDAHNTWVAMWDAAPAATAAQPERWRYVKTGATYTEVGRGLLKDEAGDLGWQSAVIYRSEADGAIYVRPVDQFNDGRFERIAGPAAGATGE